MLLIAGGARLSVSQEDIRCEGHAIEVRINAEDPALNFRRDPGRIDRLVAPERALVRFDRGFDAGSVVPPW